MSDYLKHVEEQLVQLTERGAHRRPRPRLDLLAVAVAVAVVAAVALVVSTIGGSAPRNTAASHHLSVNSTPRPGGSHPNAGKTNTPVPPTMPAGGPVPPGFGPESFTAIGELTWWLLGTAPCSSPPCTSIVRTTDGGRNFVGIPAPRTNAVSQLRFANSMDGFAYGPALWVTHDGGARWHAIQLFRPGHVRELAIGGGYVYAIITNPSTGAGRLLRSPVNANSWSVLPAAGDAFAGLWVHGSNPDVVLEAASPGGAGDELLVSHDGGASFAHRAAPPNVSCQFEEPGPPVIWAHCATGTLSGTWRSVDGGRRFTAVGRALPELPNSAAFGAASRTTAVVGYRQLYRTTNGGANWAAVSGVAGITWWQYLGFTDPTHGAALGYVGSQRPSNGRLYYTIDGGASYHLVTIR